MAPPPERSSPPPGPRALPLRPEGGERGRRESELELAEVVGVFGVRGEVRVHLHNRESDWLDRWRDLVLVAPDGTRYAARVRAREGASDRVICAIEGIDDRDLARALEGFTIVVERDRLPKPAEGEVYVWQIVGLPVVTADGVERGRVRQVHTSCPTPILEIDVPGLRDPAFVPLVPPEVDVDVGLGRVLVPDDALEEG